MNDSEKDLLMRMGVCLLLVQQAESLLRFCLTFVLQKQSPLTLELIESQKEAEKKKTLGFFLIELRKRADLDDRFDSMLSDFLTRRNQFVHNITDLEGWDRSTEAGQLVARNFIDTLTRQAIEISNTLTGLVMTWQKQTGFDVPVPKELEEIVGKYRDQVDSIFFEKSPDFTSKSRH